jgi:hypothetical protein
MLVEIEHYKVEKAYLNIEFMTGIKALAMLFYYVLNFAFSRLDRKTKSDSRKNI